MIGVMGGEVQYQLNIGHKLVVIDFLPIWSLSLQKLFFGKRIKNDQTIPTNSYDPGQKVMHAVGIVLNPIIFCCLEMVNFYHFFIGRSVFSPFFCLQLSLPVHIQTSKLILIKF